MLLLLLPSRRKLLHALAECSRDILVGIAPHDVPDIRNIGFDDELDERQKVQQHSITAIRLPRRDLNDEKRTPSTSKGSRSTSTMFLMRHLETSNEYMGSGLGTEHYLHGIFWLEGERIRVGADEDHLPQSQTENEGTDLRAAQACAIDANR